jgi:predicted Zn-dependent protease
MKKNIVIVGLFASLVACQKVPITGRKQLSLVPESEMISLSLTSYKEFLSKNPPVSETEADAQMVKNVGRKVSQAVEAYMRKEGLSSRLQGYNWEFNLVNNKEVNAWCMSGGKVVVYSGLLPVTQTETALACVIGHEIAHAVARHGGERMSQGLIQQVGGAALQVALSQKPQLTKDILLQSYGVSSQLGLLAYSRAQESEADKMGLIFMAMAGYDPSEAVAFWQRMAQAGGGKAPMELLSSHPSDAKRIADIKAYLPTARKYYKPTASR